MLLLPYDIIIYKSPLHPLGITGRLNGVVRADTLFNYEPGKNYEGELLTNSFNIRKVYSGNYLNKRDGISHMPQIKGIIIHDPVTDGSIIKMKISMNVFTKGIIILVIGVSGFITYQNEQSQSLLMIPAAYIIFLVLVKVESYFAKKYFKQLFDAEILK